MVLCHRIYSKLVHIVIVFHSLWSFGHKNFSLGILKVFLLWFQNSVSLLGTSKTFQFLILSIITCFLPCVSLYGFLFVPSVPKYHRNISWGGSQFICFIESAVDPFNLNTLFQFRKIFLSNFWILHMIYPFFFLYGIPSWSSHVCLFSPFY